MTTSSTSISTKHLTNQASAGALRSLATRAFATSAEWSPLALRATLAVVMFPHGAQKALGWFGGYGFEGTMGWFTKQIGLPAPLAFLAIATEFVGPVLLVAGIGTRFVAAAFVAIMLGAIASVHAPFGFFMNWFGNQKGEGYEYHLLVIGMAIALIVAGAGRLSIDRRIGDKLARHA